MMAGRRMLITRWQMKTRAVIRYEYTHGTCASVIHERPQNEYSEEAMSRQMVGHSCCVLNEERQNVEEEGRYGCRSKSGVLSFFSRRAAYI
ncbi:hypothetical protein TNCV_4597821 [Trichonephila clavipes]|nr:hypothetical protein TNCV_4597821 [Trichonephila clavipes]